MPTFLSLDKVAVPPGGKDRATERRAHGVTSTLCPQQALVGRVIDAQLVRAVFQPIVDLDTGETVGYEALARGPEASALASPMELLRAARDAGRLGELDWLCRLAALRAASAARLPQELMLFLNLEPSTVDVPCPAHLAEEFDELSRGRRLMIELTERSLLARPERLLDLVHRVHDRGWGVAVDDVGAEPESLTLMPFLSPDVIKLDLRLVRNLNEPAVAEIALAARAESERSGAFILAEGIETPEQADAARVLGARYGQGWLLGRPVPLPASFTVPSRPLNPLAYQALPSRSPAGAGKTPFEIVAAARPTRPARKRHLLAVSRQLERTAATLGHSSVLLACFQDARHFTPATRRRYAQLGRSTAFTAALGVGMQSLDLLGVRGAGLDRAAALQGEWNVVVVGPHYAGALVARDRGEGGPESERQFDYVITHDRELALEAARSLLRAVRDSGS